MANDTGIPVRSFRPVFDFERRLYRVDRIRLNPGGIPVRGLLWAPVMLVVVLLWRRIPVLGVPLHVFPWVISYAALPIGLTYLVTVAKVEGRWLHKSAISLTRSASEPKRLQRFQPAEAIAGHDEPGEIVFLPEGSTPRRVRYTGPGRVAIRVPHRRTVWNDGARSRVLRRPRITITPGSGAVHESGRVLELRDGVTLEVGPPRTLTRTRDC
ncbi:MAG: hypothetical protein LC790_14160 [Actinobacteria bacterium]|nr:hypothetical protein [Actinomycetota bacterium]